MPASVEQSISEWKPVSELRQIDVNISGFGYSKDYIEANKLAEKKSPHWSNMITGRVCFFEPLEVMEESGVVLYRENDERIHIDEPTSFITQFGVFNNHNHGEFTSWLGKDDYAGLSEKDREMHRLFGREDYYIPGNFCDMFDCGEYSFAISNLMHMGLGRFKIVRIDKNYTPTVLFTTDSEPGWTCLEYFGRFQNELGHVIIASGHTEKDLEQSKERVFKHRTLLFQVDGSGNCSMSREWEIQLSSANSIVVQNPFAFFGQNKMVTRLNLATGDLVYLTNKTEEEQAALLN